MGEFGQIGHHRRRIGPRIILVAQFMQGGRNIALHHRLEQIDHPCAVGQPQHRADNLAIDLARAMGNRLIEQRQRVAHRAFGGTRHQRQRFGVDLHPFQPADFGEMGNHHRGFDPSEVEPLAARQDGHGHLTDIGGRKNEFGVRRRLFQRFQKGIERAFRQHVHFVDDIDLVARRDGRITHPLVDRAHIVNAGMRGRIHFQHVDMARFDDGAAMHALAWHGDGRPAFALERLVIEATRQNTRRGGFADPAHARQNPCLRNPSRRKGIGQGLHHGILPDQILEALRAVFARQNPIGCGFV